MRDVLIGFGIAVALWLVVVFALIALGRRSQARELATLIPNLLVLFRGLLRDPRVPGSDKLWLGLAVVWIASPIDLIPGSHRGYPGDQREHAKDRGHPQWMTRGSGSTCCESAAASRVPPRKGTHTA